MLTVLIVFLFLSFFFFLILFPSSVSICDYLRLRTFRRPLFASGLLSIMDILLDQIRQDELQIIGCETLFDFVNNQVSVSVTSLSYYVQVQVQYIKLLVSHYGKLKTCFI